MSTSPQRIWTVGSLLTWTTDFFARKGIDEPRLSAELLLAHALDCTRMALYTRYENVPPEGPLTAFREMVKQRAEHVPVAYLVGKAWFYSLEFAVTRDVLIPRPDTETLVETVITHIRVRSAAASSASADASALPAVTPGDTVHILDLCTGSGCIAIALAKNISTAHVTATDLSTAALAVAQKNIDQHKLADRVKLASGDLFAALTQAEPAVRFDVIAANPPYIATEKLKTLEPQVREHEPVTALDGGADGLEPHRRILAEAREHLHPGGMLVLEIAYDQAEAARELFTAAGYLDGIRIVRDAAGNARCVVGLRRL